jgi:hypothetical protein
MKTSVAFLVLCVKGSRKDQTTLKYNNTPTVFIGNHSNYGRSVRTCKRHVRASLSQMSVYIKTGGNSTQHTLHINSSHCI